MRIDVLIVGAGPAGCALGLMLGQPGRSVLVAELLDAHQKRKLCGGALHADDIDTFNSIFGLGAFEALSPYAPPELVCQCLEATRRTGCQFQILPRKRLDDYCLSQYEAMGGRLADRMRLTGVDATRHLATFEDLRHGVSLQVEYGALVGADGASSTVRRLVTGHRQRVCVAVQGDVARTRDEAVFRYHPGLDGYCWHLPHEEGATVGCMLHGATVGECRAFLAQFCASLGMAVPPLRGAPIPEGDDVLLHPAEDVWLVGDAAGLIDPHTGGGIAHALESARALAGSLTGGEPYEQAMAGTVARVGSAHAALSAGYLRACLGIARASRW